MSDEFYFSQNSNVIAASGALTITKYRHFLAALHRMTTRAGYSDIFLDFRGLTAAFAPSMLAIISQIQKYKQGGIDFVLQVPEDDMLRRLFVNANWAHFIDPEHYDYSERSPTYDHSPTRKFFSSSEQHRLVDESIDIILRSIEGLKRPQFRAFEWAINEITDNVLVHSSSTVGGFIQVTAIRNQPRIQFVVADAGHGIASTLRTSYSALRSDREAVEKAIQEGVTRDKKIGQGNGLFGSYQVCVKSDGVFNIHSNRASLYYTKSSGLHLEEERVPLNGALVVCEIDYRNQNTLEEALNFGGTPYTPTDHLEIKYEAPQPGEIVFSLLDETVSLGSREAGGPVRTKLLNILAMLGAQRCIVDLKNINIMSSSFADEVFGKLFLEIGPMKFMKLIQFTNGEDIVTKIIDKAIAQRMMYGQSSAAEELK